MVTPTFSPHQPLTLGDIDVALRMARAKVEGNAPVLPDGKLDLISHTSDRVDEFLPSLPPEGLLILSNFFEDYALTILGRVG